MVEFNEHNHEYKVDGVVKRSVTQVLKDAGIVEDYSNMPDYYRLRGINVHKACVLYAQGFLDWDSLDEGILSYVETFKRIVEALGLSYISAEQPVYDPKYDICGTYDLIMRNVLHERVLVELKTGGFPMWGGLQLASYERMVEVDNVMGVSLKEGKIYDPDKDFKYNHEVLEQIHNGTFDLVKWQANRKRRGMRLLKW